jgi:hypothetical protein
MEFILMHRIKCWYNTVLQVLTIAPALYALIIHQRSDAADILKSLFHIHGYLRELILKDCCLGEDSTFLITRIVELYPDLQVLSLEGCRPITLDGYCHIGRLVKLSELNLSNCKVDYIYVKLLEIHVCVCEHM